MVFYAATYFYIFVLTSSCIVAAMWLWRNKALEFYSCVFVQEEVVQTRSCAIQLPQKTKNSPVQSSPRLHSPFQPPGTSWHLMYALILRN